MALAIAVFALVFLAACDSEPETATPDGASLETADLEGPQEGLRLTKVAFEALPDWPTDAATGDDLVEAVPALQRSCRRITALPATREITFGSVLSVAADWHAACQAVLDIVKDSKPTSGDLRHVLEAHFTAFSAHDRAVDYAAKQQSKDKTAEGDPKPADQGLFTGYFEAELQGDRVKSAAFPYPIYGRPKDHITANLGAFDPDLAGKRLVGRVQEGRFIPYPSRETLESEHLLGKGLELYWARDPIDVFLLQVQGSGRIVLPDDTVARIGFAAHNGHPYKSIGRVLIERGDLKAHQASWDGIRGWIDNNPEKANALLWENPRFIFFREIDGEGPIGSEGLALTPGRSLAVDRRYIAMGTPIWLDTTWPSAPEKPLRRLMVAQDTGGAIKGVVRGDFFWGYGAEALAYAGKMKSRGRYFLLLPNPVAEIILRQNQPAS